MERKQLIKANLFSWGSGVALSPAVGGFLILFIGYYSFGFSPGLGGGLYALYIVPVLFAVFSAVYHLLSNLIFRWKEVKSKFMTVNFLIPQIILILFLMITTRGENGLTFIVELLGLHK